MRLLAESSTDGSTWTALKATPYLTGSICQGSTVSAAGVLFFSHPFSKSSRSNGWIKYSNDGGASWWLWRQIDGSSFGYSSLTLVDVNQTHVSLGVVYEGNGGLRYAVVTDFLPTSSL
jgi:hypothetical protein